MKNCPTALRAVGSFFKCPVFKHVGNAGFLRRINKHVQQDFSEILAF
jgi:hypothetical protein